MKNLYYLIMMLFVGFAFTGCEPMEDIHDEIDATLDNVEGNIAYTLTEDDYEDILEFAYPNFSSEEEAKELIPVVLSENFPALGKGSSVNVSYMLYAPISVEDYTLTAEDYPGSNAYFSTSSQVSSFLEDKFETTEEGDYVTATYNVVASDIPFKFSDSDYDIVEDKLGDTYDDPSYSAARYNNFDRREGEDAYWSDDMIYEAIDAVLSERMDGVTGQLYEVTYDVYTGSPGSEMKTVRFDGNSYVEFQTTPDGEAYEITDADIEYIVAELADEDGFGPSVSNLDSYGNFNRQTGGSTYWSDSMLETAFGLVLTNNFPDAEDGKVYEVGYEYYQGGMNNGTFTLINNGGTYETATSISTIEETKTFAYTNGSWNMPLTLEGADYSAMGQSYPNFSDQDEAMYKIAIWLEMMFPYAEEGDFAAVAYDFYSGGVSTRYANFVFEDGSFEDVPSVIEQKLQFGYDGNVWVPDNTIKYSLTGSDYAIIASELEATYPNAVSSMARYSNFDRREGNSAYWSEEMILEAMNVLLDEIAPDAEEGQKYLFTYDIYNGTNTTEDMYVIKENGEWVLFVQ
ncbi:hypothetical protein E0K83_05780 [Gramella sp. BOM4]|nr:hypothetical protein [Christiangramia bathymodioli]